MNISATVNNSNGEHTVFVSTQGNEKTISIPSKSEGNGSAINGGELLFLSLATCFCNDIYREAAKRNMKIDSVRVTVNGKFGQEGEPASLIEYVTEVLAEKNTKAEIADLINYVDKVAEIHNTLRKGINVSLKNDYKE